MVTHAIGVSIPFGLALLILVAETGVKDFARRAWRTIGIAAVDEEAAVAKSAIELAVYVYRQLSFVFSVLVASAACVGFSVVTKYPVAVAVAAAALLGILPTWILRWQGLKPDELDGKEGKMMRRLGFWTIVVEWLATVAAHVASA